MHCCYTLRDVVSQEHDILALDLGTSVDLTAPSKTTFGLTKTMQKILNYLNVQSPGLINHSLILFAVFWDLAERYDTIWNMNIFLSYVNLWRSCIVMIEHH